MRLSSTPALGIIAALALCVCSCGSNDLDPTPPAQIVALKKMENPPAEAQSWVFLGSADSWSAAYADAAGEVRLRVYAFVFPDAETAGTTYETSRMRSETGTGDYREAGEKRIGGTVGLRLADDHGVYFQYRRGLWLIVLSGANDALFAEAVRGIPWAARAQPGRE
jgi:hypothetical protein